MNIVQRRVAQASTNPRAASIAFLLSGAVAATILFLLTDKTSRMVHGDINAVLILIVATFSYGLFERGRFFAAKLLDASVFTTVINLCIVFTVFCSIIFLGEAFTVEKLAGSLLILISLLLVSYTRDHHKISKKGIAFTCLISIFLGIAWTVDKKATEFFEPSLYALLMWTLPAIVIVLPSLSIKDVQKEFQNSGKGVLTMATLNVLGYYAQLKALSLADATIVMPIIQLSTLSTVGAGILFLHERDNIWRKCVAGILALLGAYFLL